MSWTLEKLPMLQELEAGGALCAGVGEHWRSLASKHTGTKKENASSFHVSPAPSTDRDCYHHANSQRQNNQNNQVHCWRQEEAMRVNLEWRGNKLITGKNAEARERDRVV